MEDRIEAHRASAERELLGLAVQARDPRGVLAQQLGGEVAERADHARLNQLHLSVEILATVLKLYGQRIAVAGWATLERVRDEHIGALEPDLLQQRVEQFPGAPHEREPTLVLARPGRLPDEHQLGIRVAGAEHHVLARRCQLLAAYARLCLREHPLERFAALLR